MPYNLTKKHGNLPRRKEDDPFFAIWRHYHDTKHDIVLTPKQQERLEIYEFAWDKYRSGMSRGETAKMIRTHFQKEKNWNIEIRTAYAHLQDACDIFGDPEKINLNMEKMIFIETCKSLITELRQSGKPEACGTILAVLKSTYGFDKENDDTAELLRALKPTQIIISSDPHILRREADELVQDINYEDADISAE
jgi:hypothetical protein